MVCTYVTNERMSTLFSEVTQTVQENTVDLQSFGNNTITVTLSRISWNILAS